MCQSPHSLTAGNYYSLFHLTAGLPPTTGDHAGKRVAVNTVCLPHICSTGTGIHHPGKTLDSLTKNVKTFDFATKITAVVLPWQGTAGEHVCHFTTVKSPQMIGLQQRVETFLVIQRLARSVRMMVLRQSRYMG